ncbi:isocitrate lyase/phosphoenolpyruvate mutase family protein [Streptomyces sp. NPDC059009]|uniref:isocitrate lyase/phosphoenolpyruvate mutase family protein n=1 Tax=Streptomyces sp. NPDC059009 TaxID=3346694 RepID=UPI0036BA205C
MDDAEAMRSVHEFDTYEDVRAALADPALVPELPPTEGEAAHVGASVAWLRASVARFSHGEPHRRRRALAEAELARLEPAVLWERATETVAESESESGSGARSPSDSEDMPSLRIRVVRTLAEALGLPDPAGVAADVATVARAYFGGEVPGADEAVARLVGRLTPTARAGTDVEGAGHATRDSERGEVWEGESDSARDNQRGEARDSEPDSARDDKRAAAPERERRTPHRSAPEIGPPLGPRVNAPEIALESPAHLIGLLVQACDATAALVAATAAGDDARPGDDIGAPLARVLRQHPPLRTMRRVAVRPTRVAGRRIAAGDLVLLHVAAAHRAHPVSLTFGAPPRVCPGRAHALALSEGLRKRPLSAFARLHQQATPLLLPNAWDHASAAALAAQGFAAVGTTSLGVAAAAGVPDGVGAAADATLGLARRLGRRGAFLFSVDVEGGFSDDADEVAALAGALYAAGAAGINLEDGRSDGTLAPVELHAAKIEAVKAAAPGLFVNARTDTHWLGLRQDETAARLARYEQAGADGVFVPGLADREGIAVLAATVLVPLNVLYTPTGPTLAELSALGVRRVSLGSLLYRSALAAAVSTATAVRDGHALPESPRPFTYDGVQELTTECRS